MPASGRKRLFDGLSYCTLLAVETGQIVLWHAGHLLLPSNPQNSIKLLFDSLQLLILMLVKINLFHLAAPLNKDEIDE